MKYVPCLVSLFFLSTSRANSIVKKIFRNSVETDTSTFADRPASFKEGSVLCPSSGVLEVNGEFYDCNNVDFLSFMSSEELMIPGIQDENMFHSSDIWGWRSPDGEMEVTILTLDTGVVMVDSTDPEDPCVLVKSHSARNPSSWGDVKVVANTAYTIKDKNEAVDPAPGIGMEVYDLLYLTNLNCHDDEYNAPLVAPNYTGNDHGHCHNVVVNTETNRVYSVGCRDVCKGGLVIFDVSENRLEPQMIGCVHQDGYTHDAQCVVYDGPDERYAGREICLAFNEDTMTIWDVTDATDPIMLSRTGYKNRAFTHQGWFNYDMTKVLLDDELDEICNSQDPEIYDAECPDLEYELSGELDTTTDVFIVTDLENPVFETVIEHKTRAIDHNLYVWASIHEKGWGGNEPLDSIPDPSLAFFNNYMAGLRIYDMNSEDASDWAEVGYFDITNTTEVKFFGVWSGYLHPSGVYAMSSIEKGLFFVKPNFDFVDAQVITSFPTTFPTSPVEEEEPEASPVLIVFLVISIIGMVAVGYAMKYGPDEKKETNEPEGDLKQTTL